MAATQNKPFHEIRDEFNSLFPEGKINLDELRRGAQHGEFRNTGLRGLHWRLFLGAFGTVEAVGELSTAAQKSRAQYSELREKFLIDPSDQPDDLDPNIHNPLSQHQESTWTQYFKNKELQKEIEMDLVRLFPEYPFFQSSDVHKQMLNILFIWSSLNSDVSYRQGMHELLGPIMYVLTRNAEIDRNDAVEGPIGTDSILLDIFNAEFVEHDAFTLFQKMMETMKEFFDTSTVRPQQPRPKGPIPLDLELAADQRKKQSGSPQQDGQLPPVIRKCQRVHYTLLRGRDPNLFAHLDKLGIEPQIYALRWVRLLFGREFHLEDTILIWDSIFADPSMMAMVDNICVAMLLYIRSQLIEKDYSGCLKRLMKYPPVEDCWVFVENALELRDKGTRKRQGPQPLSDDTLVGAIPTETVSAPTTPSKPTVDKPPLSYASPSPLRTPTVVLAAENNKQSPTSKQAASKPNFHNPQRAQEDSGRSTPTESAVDAIQGQLSDLRKHQLRTATRLGTLVRGIERQLVKMAIPASDVTDLLKGINELQKELAQASSGDSDAVPPPAADPIPNAGPLG